MLNKVMQARQVLGNVVHRTAVLTSETLSRRLGADIFFKCENFQKCGAFKIRGAYYAMSRVRNDTGKDGVLTFSSGNHAQAVAAAGRRLRLPTTVVMPNNAPRIKRQATEAYGATVIGYDPDKTTREAVVADLSTHGDYTVIPPFNHPDVIAGQGTAVWELFEDHPRLDLLLAPCGGGGLLSGSAIATKHLCPSCRVVGIEPELADDATRSFRSGTLQTVTNPPTIADGTRTACLGDLTFPLIQQYVDDMQTVSERSIMEAVAFLYDRLKIVVEPSGALGLAAVLSAKVPVQGRIGILLSGGNMDGHTLAMIFSTLEQTSSQT